MMAARQRLADALRTYGRLGHYARRERASLAAATGATLLLVAVDLARPWPIKVVLDQVILGRDWSLLPQRFASPDKRGELLVVCCAAILVLATLSGLLAYLRAVFVAQAGHNAVQRLRKDAYAKLLDLSLNFHDRHPRGDLLMRITGDASAMKMLLVEGVFFLAQELAIILGVILVMAAIDLELTAIALVTVPSVAFVVLRTGMRLKAAAARQRRKEGEIATSAAEALDAVPVIQAYGLEESSIEQLRRRNKRSRKAGLLAARLEASMSRSTEIAIAAGTAVLLLLGAQRVLSGAMSAGELIVLISYVRTLYKPLRRIATRSAKLFKSAASGERILDILHQPTDLRSPRQPRPLPTARGEVNLEAVRYAYDAGHEVLRGIDLHLSPGEHMALIGPNGAGKSTLASLLNRLRDPQQGLVTLDGIDVRELSLEELRRHVAVVFQRPVLFDGSILENIQMAAPNASEETVLEAANQAGVTQFAGRLPADLLTRVGEGGNSLSGGQRQRIALARALVRRPSILILDEPTSAIDDLMARQLRDQLPRRLREKTILCISHDEDWIFSMDRVVELNEGRVVFDGDQKSYRRRLAGLGLDTAGAS